MVQSFKVRSGPGKFDLLCMGLGGRRTLNFTLIGEDGKEGVAQIDTEGLMRKFYGGRESGEYWLLTGTLQWMHPSLGWPKGLFTVQGKYATGCRFDDGFRGQLELEPREAMGFI